ncbi:MAG: hypothetical protein JXR81_02375 [Candidatus Goldbacteria bacterium]|nr:hypothetical protein [Candidatus Goldiibacteriota bacterium]
MKKSVCLWVLLIIILSFIAVSCAKHVSPAAVEEPVIAELTGMPTFNITLSPDSSATATSTGSVTSSYTPTHTHTSTNTLSATATSTATNTTGSGYRVKSIDVYSSGIIKASMIFTYEAGGSTPTALSEMAFDSAGSVSMTASVEFDFLGNTSSMSVIDDSGNLIQTMSSNLVDGKVVRQEVRDGSGVLLEYAVYQYDTADKLIRKDFYDGSGTLLGSEVTTYNAAGFEVTVEKYSGTVLSQRDVNTYNASNLLIKKEAYVNGSLFSYAIMDYNAAGKVILFTLYDETNTVIGTTSYAYNSAGNQSEVHSVMSLAGMSSNSDIYYTYNAQDLPVEINTTQTLSGIPMMTMRSVITYEAF